MVSAYLLLRDGRRVLSLLHRLAACANTACAQGVVKCVEAQSLTLTDDTVVPFGL
jgi:hypothetical protein